MQAVKRGILRETVLLVIRSVIGEQNSERYHANNIRKTENNVSYRSYTQGPVEVESCRITRFSAKCIENEIRRFSFSLS